MAGRGCCFFFFGGGGGGGGAVAGSLAICRAVVLQMNRTFVFKGFFRLSKHH